MRIHTQSVAYTVHAHPDATLGRVPAAEPTPKAGALGGPTSPAVPQSTSRFIGPATVFGREWPIPCHNTDQPLAVTLGVRPAR
jgi:hypothetical protein